MPWYKNESNLLGPFPLTSEELKKDKYDNRGVYLLAHEKLLGYQIKYVGRGHLRTRIKKGRGTYDTFYYRAYPSEKGRFKKECTEYHRYGKSKKLDNDIHPARPKNSSLSLCTEQGCKGEA